jgi:hypothetical protein
MSSAPPSIRPLKIQTSVNEDLFQYLFLYDVESIELDRHIAGLMKFLETHPRFGRTNLSQYFHTLEKSFHGLRDQTRRIALLWLFLATALHEQCTDISHSEFIRGRCPQHRFDKFYDKWNQEVKKFSRGEPFTDLTIEEKQAIEASEKKMKTRPLHSQANVAGTNSSSTIHGKPPNRSIGDIRYEDIEHFIISMMTFYVTL